MPTVSEVDPSMVTSDALRIELINTCQSFDQGFLPNADPAIWGSDVVHRGLIPHRSDNRLVVITFSDARKRSKSLT